MPQGDHGFVVGLAFDAAVPGTIVTSDPSRLDSPLAPLCLTSVGHQIAQRVNPSCAVTKFTLAAARPAASIEDVGEPSNRCASSPTPWVVAPPKVADMVPEAIIPFAPTGPEGANLVAVRAHVPGLGNDLDLAQHGIFTDRQLERVILINVMPLVSDQGASPGRSGSRPLPFR